MGVDRNDYIVRGWKLPYQKDVYWNDKNISMVEGHVGEKFTLIGDGMCGEYLVFGIILYTDNDYEGWKFKVIDNSQENDDELKSKYQEIFNEEPSEPKTFIFSHYS